MPYMGVLPHGHWVPDKVKRCRLQLDCSLSSSNIPEKATEAAAYNAQATPRHRQTGAGLRTCVFTTSQVMRQLKQALVQKP